MNRSLRPSVVVGRMSVSGVLAGVVLSGSALADLVIDPFGSSMTVFRASSVTPVQGVRPQALQRVTHVDGTPSFPVAESMAPPQWDPPTEWGGGFEWSGGGGDCGTSGGGGPPEMWQPEASTIGVPSAKLGPVRLDLGAYDVREIDLSLASPGVRWVIGRQFNGVQKTSGGSFLDCPPHKNPRSLPTGRGLT